MISFGMKGPDRPEDIYTAAERCRKLGLRYMELSFPPPPGYDREKEGVELLPTGCAAVLKEAAHSQMEAALESLSSQQFITLLPLKEEGLEALADWANLWLDRSSAAGELWDVYDGQRRPTGRLHPRGKELGGDDYHLVVHVWIRDSRGRYLITRRSPNKGHGGMWESPGGSAQAGDDSLRASLREVREETGLELDPCKGEIVLSYREDHFFCDVWLFRQDFDISRVVLQPGETCDCRCACKDEILKLQSQGLFVPFQRLDQVLSAP